ncbi:MAG: LysM peptidoglycan-binding domain-containing protein [Endozoicomonas sp. (ex Botrylloides leachii)]|nr:LysM peptidoglycan-binding domain-containing protein [Endozoicomonas sp. (ex Botrylloides leachii)]
MGRLLLTFMLLATPLINAASEKEPLIKEGVVKSYTIKKGDSLWKVAEHFLNSPWRWNELWQANPQIKKPDLIYPGDVVSLIYIDDKPKLTLSYRAGARQTIKLRPKIRTVPIDESISAIPLSAINKFLKEDRVISLDTELIRAPYIFSMSNNRIAASTGDKVYARGHLFNETAQHEIIRRGEKIKDPLTGQILGVIGYKVADAKLLGFNKGIASIEVLNAKMPVKKGDRVLAKDTFVPADTFSPKRPIESVVGKVLAVINGGRKAGKHDTVVVDLGLRNSIEAGDILVVKESTKARDPLTRKQVRLPPRNIGVVMIYRPFDSLSYGIVMSTKEDLQVGDYLTNPL